MPRSRRPEPPRLRHEPLRAAGDRDGRTALLERGSPRPAPPHTTGPPRHPAARPPGAGPRRPWARRAAVAVGALVLGFVLGFALRDAGLQLETVGPAPNAVLGAAQADDLVFRIRADLESLMETATLEYDGADVLDQAYVGDGELTFRPRDLSDGVHTLRFSVEQPFVPWRARRSWTFTVDRTRPRIEITGPERPAVRGAPVVLSGRVDEPARVTVDGEPVAVAEDGTFSHTFTEAPTGAVSVRATDRAGNSRGVRLNVPMATRTPALPVRAVHMSAVSWASDDLRESVIRMLEEGRINAVELDLKEESGIVGYDSRVAFARRIGAVEPSYVLADAVREIHERGGRVIGRIVAFVDPRHARWAWENGARQQVVQTPDGRPYAGYGGFTNFADPTVRAYNIAIAREAAEAGVDEILYDYIRRPDGPIETMRFPGLQTGAQASVVSFLAEAREALEPTGAFLGASIFGIAAHRPDEIAQDVGRMARNVDYIAPMVYPSHWARGSYGVADPESEPGEIVARSIEHFKKLAEGSGARIVPWIQGFSLRVPYGAEELRAQIRALEAAGIEEYLVWDPDVTYPAGGLPTG